MKFKIKNLKLKILYLSAFLFLLLTTYYLLPTVSAQSLCQPSGSSIRSISGGLITTPDISTNTKFYSQTGTCIFNPKTSFAPFKIPTYDDLKSIYYTQSKAPKATIASLTTITDGTVYFVAGDLTISSNPAGSGSALIFVERNLNIRGSYTYGSGTTGTVFIVKGNINIDINSNRIDAILMSEGQGGYSICTSYEFSSSTCPVSHITPQPISNQLTVNGSLISLNKDNPIRFRRSLTDNTLPAEIVIQQPKYLVLLRNILSEKLSRWSEVTEDVIIDITPTTAASPPTTPTNLAVTGVTLSSVSLSWTGSSEATGYLILRCNGSPTCTPATLVGSTSLTVFQNINLSCGTEYRYAVRATNTVGESSNSNIVSQTTSACQPLTVNILANSSNGPITLAHNSTVSLSWTTTNSPTSCSGTGSWSGAKATAGGTESQGPLSGGTSGTTYTYTITCSNADGSASDSVTVNVNPTPPHVYTIASGYSGTQGQNNWYYYWMPNTGPPSSQATYTSSLMQMQSWFGEPDNSYWTKPGSWMAVDPTLNVAGDTELAFIYWKAPAAGEAQVTVTERRIDQGGGNGFWYGIGYAGSVGSSLAPRTNPTGQVAQFVGGDDTSTHTLTKTQEMLGTGDAIYYYKDSASWTFGDMSNYTITIIFTPTDSSYLSYSWSGTASLTGTTKDVSKAYDTGGTKTGTVTVTSGAETQSCTTFTLL